MYSEGDIRSPGTLRFVNDVNERISAVGARALSAGGTRLARTEPAGET